MCRGRCGHEIARLRRLAAVVAAIFRDGEMTTKIKFCAFEGVGLGGREENRPKKLFFFFFSWERHDNNFLKVENWLSKHFVVIAQAPRFSCDFEANSKNRPAKRKTLRFLQRNGCEPACGHRGHSDFAMRFFVPLSLEAIRLRFCGALAAISNRARFYCDFKILISPDGAL